MYLLTEILILLLISFLPFVELRLAIPVGILTASIPLLFGWSIQGLGLHPLLVFVICVVANILLGFILYNLLFALDSRLRHSFLKKPYAKLLDRSHRKMSRFTHKYGTLGVALFIAVPLPGSGVYSGSIGAFVLGLDKRHFYTATMIGVTIAGIIVTGLTVSGMAIVNWFIRFF